MRLRAGTGSGGSGGRFLTTPAVLAGRALVACAPLQELLGDLGESRLAAAQPWREQPVDPPDQHPRGDVRDRCGSRDPPVGVFDALRGLGDALIACVERPGPAGHRLVHQEVRAGGLLARESDDRRDRRGDRLRGRPRFDRFADLRRQTLVRIGDRRDERIVSVGEVVVERWARDSCVLDHRGNVRAGVSVAVRGAHHPAQQAFALGVLAPFRQRGVYRLGARRGSGHRG